MLQSNIKSKMWSMRLTKLRPHIKTISWSDESSETKIELCQCSKIQHYEDDNMRAKYPGRAVALNVTVKCPVPEVTYCGLWDWWGRGHISRLSVEAVNLMRPRLNYVNALRFNTMKMTIWEPSTQAEQWHWMLQSNGQSQRLHTVIYEIDKVKVKHQDCQLKP